MKKNKRIIVNVHSIVDVITNSSTELFVCDTKKSLDQVKEILEKMLDLYNSTLEDEHPYSFEDVFCEPYIYTKEIYERKKDDDYWGYDNEETIGKIIIMSSSDNSIPFSLFDLIEDVFNANRKHLG